jgi:hypothetical protein
LGAAKINDLGCDSGNRVLNLTRKGGHQDQVALPPSVGEAIYAMVNQRGNPTTSGLLFLIRRMLAGSSDRTTTGSLGRALMAAGKIMR